MLKVLNRDKVIRSSKQSTMQRRLIVRLSLRAGGHSNRRRFGVGNRGAPSGADLEIARVDTARLTASETRKVVFVCSM